MGELKLNIEKWTWFKVYDIDLLWFFECVGINCRSETVNGWINARNKTGDFFEWFKWTIVWRKNCVVTKKRGEKTNAVASCTH